MLPADDPWALAMLKKLKEGTFASSACKGYAFFF
jgi:hypothetical protein